ncbi:hypothetical protein FQA39_LY13319 [Lamprigera yunnana]|nr:hypothetical protein FQA39_LY13319 [Lamprigera yunnana]
MAFVTKKVVILFLIKIHLSLAALTVRFERCDLKGFTCKPSLEVSGRHDITYKCENTTVGQDIQLYLWAHNSVASITSLTIQDCKRLELSFTCSGENKPILWLKLKNITTVEILQANVVHNPPKIIFEDIGNITLRREMFTQIRKTLYKPGCFIPSIDLHSITFKNVTIDTIESEAFRNLTDVKEFYMENVRVNKIHFGAVQVQFVPGAAGYLNKSHIGVMEPLAVQVNGDGLSILNSHIEDMWGSSINGTMYDFEFINNTVNLLRSGAISILAKSVYINNNLFRNVESGCLKKITPGLLHDSTRNFGTLYFGYDFNQNVIEHVQDGGVRPDIEAYKNVATHINYTSNTLLCSCEATSWLGAEVDLGFGYTVLKDFNTMILDPKNRNVCNFNPCLCFGVRPPDGVTIDFWMWNFSKKFDIAIFTITDCDVLSLRFGCNRNHSQRIKILYVHHIRELKIVQDQLVCNPTSIIFENIEILRSIPRNTFSQAQTLCNQEGCMLNKVVFENVNIDTIETNAIELIDNVQLFRITNANIKNINTGGIQIINNKDASVYILNSVINTLDSLAIQINANKLTIAESIFNLISYNSIYSTLHTFEFDSNSVLSLLPAGLSIKADNVIIHRNQFHNIRTGAFEKISGLTNFQYKFYENHITDVDVGGLHPLLSSSDDSIITFVNNSFSCTCDGLSWLGSDLNFGKGLKYFQSFYKNILEVENNNKCLFKNCLLPLRAVKKLIDNKDCQVPTIESETDFCDNYEPDENSSHIQLLLWQFNAPVSITSLTVEDCQKLELSFTCSGENKPIQWFKLKNITTVEITQPYVGHSPPKIILEDIGNINLPREVFVQIKKTFFKPGCFIPAVDLHSFVFKNVTIGTIEPEAFKKLTDIKEFYMENVQVDKIQFGAIQLNFAPGSAGVINNSSIDVMEPLAIQANGDGFSILNSHIKNMWGSSINGSIYDFQFANNTVDLIQSGAITILAQNVYIDNNLFRKMESGAFQYISPGLVHDSSRDFGKLHFTYDFNKNLLEHVEDGGVRPDIEAYRNVASLINYRKNVLQCSCESVSLLGGEVDLGSEYSVLKEFNSMILDPKNDNVCNFKPCVCFGVRSPVKKGSPAAAVF